MKASYSATRRSHSSQGLVAVNQYSQCFSRVLYHLFVGEHEVAAWHDALYDLRVISLKDYFEGPSLCPLVWPTCSLDTEIYKLSKQLSCVLKILTVLLIANVINDTYNKNYIGIIAQ